MSESVAIIEKPGSAPVRIALTGNVAESAAQLATLTGCRVRVEQTYEPAAPVPVGGGISAAARLKGARVPGSLPERILARMNANPQRTFRVADFLDMAAKKKRIGAVVYRLCSEEKVIRRVGKGLFRALHGDGSVFPPPVAASPPARGRVLGQPTAKAKVLAFMRQHPGEWLRSPSVARGMGLAADLASAVRSSLLRLRADGHVERDVAGAWRLLLFRREEVAHVAGNA